MTKERGENDKVMETMVWVTRDEFGMIGMWVGDKPVLLNTGIYRDGGFCIGRNIEPLIFKMAFRFTPRKRSCKQMELTLKPKRNNP